MSTAELTSAPGTTTRRRRRTRSRRALGMGSALGLGITMIWFSLLVLIPLVAVLIAAADLGLAGFWDVVSSPQTAAALRLTVVQALGVTLLNVVMGTALAWVLVRDHFWGKRLLDVVIDVPFALPTIVAGLVLLSLYGPNSTAGRQRRQHPGRRVPGPGVRDAALRRPDRAAGARDPRARHRGGRRVARREPVHDVPPGDPAVPDRRRSPPAPPCPSRAAISEYGSLVLLSGNLPGRTEVASVRVLTYIENGSKEAAAAVAAILLLVALLVIVALDVLQRRLARRGD